jgi:hypothetical protein
MVYYTDFLMYEQWRFIHICPSSFSLLDSVTPFTVANLKTPPPCFLKLAFLSRLFFKIFQQGNYRDRMENFVHATDEY